MSKSFVIDTNSLISAVLIEGTSSSRALDKAILLGKLIFSQSTADEFIEVLFRKKLAYIIHHNIFYLLYYIEH